MDRPVEAAIETDTGENPHVSDAPLERWPWGPTWILLTSLSAVASAIIVFATRSPISTQPAHPQGYFVVTLSAAICLLAALFDGWTTRIPNALTYPTILVGLSLNLFMSICVKFGWMTPAAWLVAPGMTQSLLGFAACAICGLAGMAFAGVGGGDIKLLIALGSLLGLTGVGMVLIASLSVALAYALCNLVVLGRLNIALRMASHKLLELAYWRRLDFSPEVPRGWGIMIPMAIPLAVGVVIVAVLKVKEGGSW